MLWLVIGILVILFFSIGEQFEYLREKIEEIENKIEDIKNEIERLNPDNKISTTYTPSIFNESEPYKEIPSGGTESPSESMQEFFKFEDRPAKEDKTEK